MTVVTKKCGNIHARLRRVSFPYTPVTGNWLHAVTNYCKNGVGCLRRTKATREEETYHYNSVFLHVISEFAVIVWHYLSVFSCVCWSFGGDVLHTQWRYDSRCIRLRCILVSVIGVISAVILVSQFANWHRTHASTRQGNLKVCRPNSRVRGSHKMRPFVTYPEDYAGPQRLLQNCCANTQYSSLDAGDYAVNYLGVRLKTWGPRST